MSALVGRCWVCLYDAVPLEDVVFARFYSEAIDGVLLDLRELFLYASSPALARAGEVYERIAHRRVVIVVCARLMSASRLLGNHIGREVRHLWRSSAIAVPSLSPSLCSPRCHGLLACFMAIECFQCHVLLVRRLRSLVWWIAFSCRRRRIQGNALRPLQRHSRRMTTFPYC